MDASVLLRVPSWQLPFIVFRIGDGLTWTVIAVHAVTHYGLPIWAPALVAAAMNLGSVPATFLWSKVLRNGTGRRRLAALGLSMAALAMVVMALGPPFWAYVLAAAAYMAFGVATAPAAAVLALEATPRWQWGAASGDLNRRTGLGLVAGTVLAVTAGLSGVLNPLGLFASVATLSAGAALVAWFVIPEAPGPRRRRRAAFEVLTTGPKRQERLVFHPPWIHHRPRLGALWRRMQRDEAPVFVGVVLLLAGAIVFLTALPGVLVSRLGFGLGVVLLAQTPSFLVSSMIAGKAGRAGDRWGERRTLRWATWLRVASVPGMVLGVLWGGWGGLALLMVANAGLGVSFALLAVTGPLFVADRLPGDPARSIGAFHAAIATGVLIGSLSSFLLILVLPLGVLYAVAVLVTAAGGLALMRGLRVPSPPHEAYQKRQGHQHEERPDPARAVPDAKARAEQTT